MNGLIMKKCAYFAQPIAILAISTLVVVEVVGNRLSQRMSLEYRSMDCDAPIEACHFVSRVAIRGRF